MGDPYTGSLSTTSQTRTGLIADALVNAGLIALGEATQHLPRWQRPDT